MAIVRRLDHLVLVRDALHKDVDCTYSVVRDEQGKRCLQLDTYGSRERKMPGKKSQSIRFSPEAIEQLKNILADL